MGIERIDKKTVTEGAPIVEAEDSPAFVFLRRDRALTVGTGKSVSLVTPFGIGVGSGGDNDDDGGEEEDNDAPNLSDIESVSYEQVKDSTNTITYNAILKVRNSSKKKDQVIAVDARNAQKDDGDGTGEFVKPTPTTPSVIFNRNGTAIAWGWDQSQNLGSYSSVSYQWQIRSTSSTTTTPISSGTKPLATTGSFPIGNSGKNRRYRVSSASGDTPATSSARFLRVRAVVVGTDNKTYYSEYSKPI